MVCAALECLIIQDVIDTLQVVQHSWTHGVGKTSGTVSQSLYIEMYEIY